MRWGAPDHYPAPKGPGARRGRSAVVRIATLADKHAAEAEMPVEDAVPDLTVKTEALAPA